MSGKRIDYGIERQRHDGFVGREALLDRLDELLTANGADRWVVVTGGRVLDWQPPDHRDSTTRSDRAPLASASPPWTPSPLPRGCR